jgi:hypothetical protein
MIEPLHLEQSMLDALLLKNRCHSFRHLIRDIRIPISMQEERWWIMRSDKSLGTQIRELLGLADWIKPSDFLRPASVLTTIHIKVLARDDRAL